jgi:hypothetical protein
MPDGTFEFVPTQLFFDGTDDYSDLDDYADPSDKITVWARSRSLNTFDPGTEESPNYVFGDWFDAGANERLTFRYITPPTASASDLGLADSSIEPDGAGVYHTATPRISGQLRAPDNATRLTFLGVEFYYLEVDTVDLESGHSRFDWSPPSGGQFVTSDASGAFLYQPVVDLAGQPSPDTLPLDTPTQVVARAVYWDLVNETYVRGLATSFTLQVDSTAVDISIDTLELVNVTNPSANPIETADPTVRGKVVNPGGSAAFVRVEFFDADAPGLALGETITDASGNFQYRLSSLSDGQTVNLRAHAYEYDPATNAFVPGALYSDDGVPENDLKFTFDSASTSGDLIVNGFALWSDSGDDQSDGVTSNPMVTGIVFDEANQTPVVGATVRFDHGDDGSIDGIAFTDGEGRFYYRPVGMPLGTPLITATPRVWDAAEGVYVDGQETQPLTFDLVDPIADPTSDNAGGKLVEFALTNPPADPVDGTTDATIKGRVVDNGSLRGIVVELDYLMPDPQNPGEKILGNDSVADQSVTTDEFGRFTASLALAFEGEVQVRARTLQYDVLTNSYQASDWTTSGPTPGTLTFNYIFTEFAQPEIGSVTFDNPNQQVTVPIANIGQLSGQTVEVEFSWSEDGPAFATRDASSGTATYSTANWTPGNYEVWVRAIAETGDVRTPKTYSGAESHSLTVVATSFVIGDLHLVSDPSSDGSTSDARIAGTVFAPPGVVDFASVSVDLLVSYGGSAYAVTTDSSGNFSVDPDTPPASGYVTVSVNIQGVSGSSSIPYSTEAKLYHFVYSSAPDGDAAQGLVAALTAIDPNWQTSQQTLDLSGSTANPTDDGRDLAEAELQRQEEERLARQEYEAALTSAQAAYDMAISQARSDFQIAIQNQGLAQHELGDFEWPTAPDDNALVIPDSSQLPQPPERPTLNGPEYDLDSDAYYQNQIAQAEQVYYAAVAAADSALQAAIQNVNTGSYRTALDVASENYYESAQQTNERFIQLFYFNEGDSDAPNVLALLNEWRELRLDIVEAWQTYYERTAELASAAKQRLDRIADRTGAAEQAVLDTWIEIVGPLLYDYYSGDTEYSGTDARYAMNYFVSDERFEQKTYDADKSAAQDLESIRAVKIKETEPILNQLRKDFAAEAQKATYAEFVARRQIYDLFRTYVHEDLLDSIGDWESLTNGLEGDFDGLAQAQRQYELDVADAEKQRDIELAGEHLIHEQAVNSAAYELAVDKANVKHDAIEAWAEKLGQSSSGGSTKYATWSDYQFALAEHQQEYELAVAELARTRDDAITSAKWDGAESEQVRLIRAASDRESGESGLGESGFIQQKYQRTVDLTTAYHDMRVDTEDAYLDRDLDVSSAWEQRWAIDYANNVQEVTHEISDASFKYSLQTGLLDNHFATTVPGGTIGSNEIDVNGDTYPDLYQNADLYGWARDVVASGYLGEPPGGGDSGKTEVLLDNSNVRISTERQYRERVAAEELSYAKAVSQAQERAGRQEHEDDYAQRVANAGYEKIALVAVADLYFDYETKVADALTTYTVDRATTIKDYELEAADAARGLATAAAQANRVFDVGEATKARDLAVNEATTQSGFDSSLAEAYIDDVTMAVGFASEPEWHAYQIALAQAEYQRVAQLGDATVDRTTQLADQNVLWATDVTSADYDLAVQQANAAYELAAQQANAIADLAIESSALGSLDEDGHFKSKSDAVRNHDIAVTEAGYTYEVAIAETYKQIGQDQVTAAQDYARALAVSTYLWTMDTIRNDFAHNPDQEGSDRDKDALAVENERANQRANDRYRKAINEYNRAFASAGYKAATNRIDYRQDWATETAEAHVQLIEDLIDADSEHRDVLRQATKDYAQSHRLAQIDFGENLADATRLHTIDVASADRDFTIAAANIDASYATEQDTIASEIEALDVAALNGYETALYSAHATLMAQAFTASSGSSVYEQQLAKYRLDAATAASAWANARATARIQNQSRLAAASSQHTTELNQANVAFAYQSAQADATYQLGQAARDAKLSEKIATADADLVYAVQVAEADRIADSAGLAATVDKMTAQETAAYYGARVAAWVAHARTYALAARNWDSAPSDRVREVVEREGKRLEQSYKQLRKSLAEATLRYIEDTNYPYGELNKPLHQAEVDYAQAVADAKVAHADRIRDALNSHVTHVSMLELTYTRNLTPYEVQRDSAIGLADRNFAVASADSQVTFQEDLQSASADLAGSQAAAETNYHVAIAGADFQSLDALGGSYVFDALEAAARQQWLEELASQYIDYRHDTAAADGQFQVDMAIAQRAETVSKSDADVAQAAALGQATIVRSDGTSLAEAEHTVATSTAENDLAYRVAIAEATHSVAYARAAYNHSVGFDTAWAEYTAPISEYWGLINYRDEVADPYPSEWNYYYQDPQLSQMIRDWYLGQGVPSSILDRIDAIAELYTQSESATPNADPNHPEDFWWPALRDREEVFAEIGSKLDREQGKADFNWSKSLAQTDLNYTSTVAAADRDRAQQLASYERQYAIDQVMAQADHDLSYAQADGTFWRDQTAAENDEREASAAAKADFLSAHYSGKADALDTLDLNLNIPWSAYQHQKALADAAAWEGIKTDYLDWQSDISDVRNDFQAARAGLLETTTSATNAANIAFATTLADQTQNKVDLSADAQFDYVVGLADATKDYRLDVANADLTYANSLANINDLFDADYGDLENAASATHDENLDGAKSAFNDTYDDLLAERRVGLAQAHSDFTMIVADAYVTTAAQIALAESNFVQQIAGDPDLPTPIVGLLPDSEDSIADLNNTYDAVESAAFVAAYAAMPGSNPWRTFLIAEATARKDSLVDGLAPATKTYRLALVGADDHYDVAAAKHDEAASIMAAVTAANGDRANAAGLLSSAIESLDAAAGANAPAPTAGYPDLPAAPAEPFPNLQEVLDVYYGGEAPFDRVAPMFRPSYVYAYNWLPGHLGKLPFYWPDQDPALGEVIWQWGTSGELVHLPQSSLLYDPYNIYPPPINPWGPGQLDDYTHVRIYAARTDQLFPAIYIGSYGAWVSPYGGTGDWGSFYGLGQRYTYMPFNDKGPVVAFDNGTDSIYGEDFAYQLDVYYGSLGDRFQLDQYSERADAILEKTANPNGGATSTVDVLLAPEDATSVTIDPATGGVTLVGDSLIGGGGSAYIGGGSATPQSSTEMSLSKITPQQSVPTWTAGGVQTMLRVLGGHELDFLREVGFVLRHAKTQYRAAGWLRRLTAFDEPTYGIFEFTQRFGGGFQFVDNDYFRENAGSSISGTKGYAALISRGGFRIEFLFPKDWTDLEAAQFIISVLHGKGSPQGLEGIESEELGDAFNYYLRNRIYDEKKNNGLTVLEFQAHERDRVQARFDQVAQIAEQYYTSLAQLAPGGSGVMALYNLQDGNVKAAAIDLVFSAPVLGAVGKGIEKTAGVVALKTIDGVATYIPEEAIRLFQTGRGAGANDLARVLKSSNNLDEIEDAVKTFLKRNGLDGPIVGDKARTLLRAAMKDVPRNANIPARIITQAHHIVPIKLFDNSEVGVLLHELGIDLNSADNGVWLPYYDYPGRTAALHRGDNLASYNLEVIERFKKARLRTLGRDEARRVALGIIEGLREDLLQRKVILQSTDSILP